MTLVSRGVVVLITPRTMTLVSRGVVVRVDHTTCGDACVTCCCCVADDGYMSRHEQRRRSRGDPACEGGDTGPPPAGRQHSSPGSGQSVRVTSARAVRLRRTSFTMLVIYTRRCIV